MSPFTKSNQTLITVCNLWPLTILLHDVKPSLTHTGSPDIPKASICVLSGEATFSDG